MQEISCQSNNGETNFFSLSVNSWTSSGSFLNERNSLNVISLKEHLLPLFVFLDFLAGNLLPLVVLWLKASESSSFFCYSHFWYSHFLLHSCNFSSSYLFLDESFIMLFFCASFQCISFPVFIFIFLAVSLAMFGVCCLLHLFLSLSCFP